VPAGSPFAGVGHRFQPGFLRPREHIHQRAVFGLSRAAVDTLAPQIIEFADIGEYLDQPVKTYSSGMFARLAMALALHLRADVLLIDEILSVGDVFSRPSASSGSNRSWPRVPRCCCCSHDLGAVGATARACFTSAHVAGSRWPPDEVSAFICGKAKRRARHSTGRCVPVARMTATRPGSAGGFPRGGGLSAQAGAGVAAGRRVSQRDPQRGAGSCRWPTESCSWPQLFHARSVRGQRTGRVVRSWTKKGFAADEIYDPVGLNRDRTGA